MYLYEITLLSNAEERYPMEENVLYLYEITLLSNAVRGFCARRVSFVPLRNYTTLKLC